MSEKTAKAQRRTQRQKPTNGASPNGAAPEVPPDVQQLNLNLTEKDIALIYMCLTQVSFKGAEEKVVAGQLQAKIEQLIPQGSEQQ